MYAGLLPPCELGWHFLDDLDGVWYAVALALVDGVTDDAVAPLGMPPLNQHRVAIFFDVGRVVHVYRVAVVLGDVGGVGLVLHH